MTNEGNANGYFVLDKHAVVTLALEGVSAVNCADFDMVPGVILDLKITKVDGHLRVEWSASYGVNGFVTARHASISLIPGKPD